MNPSMQADLSDGAAFLQGNGSEFFREAREKGAKIVAMVERETAGSRPLLVVLPRI